MCRELRVKDRWDVVNPCGRRGGLLVFWGNNIQVHQIIKTDFSFELEVEGAGSEGKSKVIFIYASTDSSVRKTQWEFLKEKRRKWGIRWVIGGDFNDIICHEDKKGGTRRLENSFYQFRSFIRDMEIEEIRFKGKKWTWANNRQGEGFIEERLDMFFGSANWLLSSDQAMVQHILTQSSDYSMVVLDSKPPVVKGKNRFIYDSRWSKMQNCTDQIQESWNITVEGSRMYKFHKRLQHCRNGLVEWRKKENTNAKIQIQQIMGQMEKIQEQGGKRDWGFLA